MRMVASERCWLGSDWPKDTSWVSEMGEPVGGELVPGLEFVQALKAKR